MDFLPQDISVDIRGKSNSASIKRHLFYTDLKSVVAIPSLDSDANQISTAISMRPAVAASNGNPAVSEGIFARIDASDMDADFKCEKLGEGDNHAGYKVHVKVFLNGQDAVASNLLSKLRNRPLVLIVTQKTGARRLINDIILHPSSQVNPKNGYHLEGEVILADEPPFFTGPIVF